MLEPPTKSSSEPVAAASLRVAVASSGSEVPRPWAWGLSMAVILAAGLMLYAARSTLGSGLDSWLPAWRRAPVESATEPLPVMTEVERPAAEPQEPEWTYVDVEAALAGLPEDTERLIGEGRGELPEFEGLDSADETRALILRNRWRSWGRIWHNRVAHLRRPMPPLAACAIHAALEPTCRALAESFMILEKVPATERVADARALFEEAAGVLEELRQPPEDAAAPDGVSPPDSAAP